MLDCCSELKFLPTHCHLIILKREVGRGVVVTDCREMGVNQITVRKGGG